MTDRAKQGRRLMSLRVSRDGGRTWGAEVVVMSSEALPPLQTGVWPPCQCLRCLPRARPAPSRPVGGEAG